MIEVNGVTKFFGDFKALDNISFDVRNGEVVGYVGLNGAGKTTTIRIAVGVLNPDSGDVLINGHSIVREKRIASRYIGWVPEIPIFEPDARALDYFVYLAGYYGISPSDARSLGRKLLEEVGLGDAINKKLKEYSQGMRKRFALAVSMISNPDNYAFDEVLNGLDPQGIAYFRDLTLKLRRNRCAVLFSSHILSEVEAIADRVVFIHRGRIVAVETMDEIKAMANPGLYIKLDRIDGKVRDLLSPYGETRIERGYIVIVNPPQDPSEILSILIKNGYKVLEYRQGHSLEDVFFRIIGEKR
ncbi:ABC transporter related [Ignisphaera aggregans DSM 17230]|uniref:ABC transporter related n=1 Tax=Ignisphaera aggregans (strain DSM 17230 / JCM 13409 / AQ1.S1) TaxID=583356 RepID=E0SRX6_IGNAA|nr:ABC transporter related [Ignisphaera aggregans DSM 17230]